MVLGKSGTLVKTSPPSPQWWFALSISDSPHDSALMDSGSKVDSRDLDQESSIDYAASAPIDLDVESTEFEAPPAPNGAETRKFVGQDATITLPGMRQTPDSQTAEEHSKDQDINGFHFGKYELIEEIGRGGMGVVYKARQKDLDRIVALKMILSSHLASAVQVGRFYAEAKAAAKMSSPHIVRIHEVGQFSGQHYFAMEFMAGPSLSKVIRQGPIDFESAAHWLQIVARGVQHLHDQGVVHRDLKPSNILFDEAGVPAVTDFGLAKTLKSDADHTNTGAIVGTPSYMAPEQAAGGRRGGVGPQSDVYSLGAILFEMLTGRPPFQCDSPLDTLVQVLEGEPPRPKRLRPGLPRSLELICMKCLEKNPSERYQTAAALAEDLERFLKKEQVEVKRATPWHRLRRWARREPALVSRLGTMALCGAIIQINHSLFEYNQGNGHRRLIAVVAAWAVVSIGFQALLRSEKWGRFSRYAWALCDVVFFTIMVYLNDGLATSLVSGYFLIIAASGLWFRERLVHYTTIISVAAYGLLVFLDRWHTSNSGPSPYRHVILASVLAVSGLIIAYQVKRVRALSQYYENRPLP